MKQNTLRLLAHSLLTQSARLYRLAMADTPPRDEIANVIYKLKLCTLTIEYAQSQGFAQDALIPDDAQEDIASLRKLAEELNTFADAWARVSDL